MSDQNDIETIEIEKAIRTAQKCQNCEAVELEFAKCKASLEEKNARLIQLIADVIKQHVDTERKTINLTERRAEFIYNAARLASIAACAPIIPIVWEKREEVFKKQFFDIVNCQCGPQRLTSPKELHNSWVQSYIAMGWIYGKKYDLENKIHPDLIPYTHLGQLERDKDAVFMALCEIARQWIY